jgi:hypothetical protein
VGRFFDEESSIVRVRAAELGAPSEWLDGALTRGAW